MTARSVESRSMPVLLFALAFGARVEAAGLDVAVTDSRGRPVADAIVTVDADGVRLPPHPPATYVIDQAELVFIPYLQVFRPGDRVVFRNSDRTRHHVYSFSPAKAFEFVLKPGESSTPLVLDRAGTIAAGCNIHDAMVTYLFVTAAPWVAQTPADGHARLTGLPSSAVTVRVWHPRLRPGGSVPVSKLQLGGADVRRLPVTLTLLPDSRRGADPERQAY